MSEERTTLAEAHALVLSYVNKVNGLYPHQSVHESLALDNAIIEGQTMLAVVRCAEALEAIAKKLYEEPPL